MAYVAPALISHYVTVHRYNPPAELIDAVLARPSFSSDPYGLLVRHILCVQHIDRSSRMPLADLETREQAVSFLRERGFHAFIRDWAMGQTIGVASHPFRHHEIEGWERMVYVAASSGGWVLHNLMRPDAPNLETSSLRDACECAIEALRAGPRDSES